MNAVQFWAAVALLLSLTGILKARQRITLRKDSCALEVESGIIFSGAESCVLEEQQVDTLAKKPVLECTQRYKPSDKDMSGKKYLGLIGTYCC